MAFREDFVWGAASSAYQTEGFPRADGSGDSIWDAFCRQPGAIANGEDGSVACDGYHRFAEDIGLLASLGLSAYRFSTSWARIDPNGDGHWNESGLRYYDRVVDCCLTNGVTPWMTLYHWELPRALEEKDGWQNSETAAAFSRFAGMMAAHFEGRVSHFITLNEPQIVLKLGYADGIHAPGKRLSLPELVSCWKNLMLAHGLSFRAIRKAAPEALIGIASTGKLCYPHSPADEDAARQETFRLTDSDWMFTHAIVLDAVCLGRAEPEAGALRKLLSEVTPEEWDTMHAVPDFIGVNSYNGSEIAAGPDGAPVYLPRPQGFACTALKWPITPEIMEYGYAFLYERYRLPLYVTECGLSCNDHIFLDGQVHDADRIDFLHRYLLALYRGCERADIRGFFHWSLTDNFEWHSGYAERFGLIYVDYPTQKRTLKDSARWYAQTVRENGKNLQRLISAAQTH